MACKAPALLLFLLAPLLFLSLSASAYNITELLSDYPNLSVLNDLLTRTKLANEINRRSTITLLAVENGGISAISSQPLDVIKRILSVHVVLDYYDERKLTNLHKGSEILTTLYQSSGVAAGKTGFLNATDTKDGTVRFGSADRGARLDSTFVEVVLTEPYNISVVQISNPIIPPGFTNMHIAPSTTPAVPVPPAKGASAPEPSADGPAVDAPTADAPTADTPTADAPTADAPSADADSPATSPGPGSAAQDEADTPPHSKSGSSAARATGHAVARAGLAAAIGAVFLGAL